MLLSDHGQSHGETFASVYGLHLKDLVRAGCGLPVSRRARRTTSGAEARTAARAALRRPEHARRAEEDTECAGPVSDPVVLASGNLGLVSFPDIPGRATREEIDRRHPALLRTLAEHRGIGFVLVLGERRGPSCSAPAAPARTEHRQGHRRPRPARPLRPRRRRRRPAHRGLSARRRHHGQLRL